MAEHDQESKTEEPTEKKVRDSLEQGKIPVSREASVFATMAALMVIQAFLIGQGVQRLTPTLRNLLDDPEGYPIGTAADATNLLTVVGLEALRFLVPLVVILVVFSLASSLLQNVPRLVLDRIKPELSRISPVQGWSRMFGMKGFVEFGKSVFKLTAVGVVVVFVLRSSEARAFEAMYTDPVALPEMILTIAMRIVSAICIATIVLVAIDLAWARFSWRRELRMTKQEIKDEHKQSEGDPHIKGKIRQLRHQRMRKRMMAAVPKASVIITNPTHYAVALSYERGMTAPICVAKGVDAIALKIREIAGVHDIPIVENVPLARALYAVVKIDEEIPVEHYHAVAEIIGYVMGLKRGMSGRRT
jgi:flagellar biosynthetic protein FlhB